MRTLLREGARALPTKARWPARAQTRASVRLGARCRDAKYSAVVVPLRSSRATRDWAHGRQDAGSAHRRHSARAASCG